MTVAINATVPVRRAGVDDLNADSTVRGWIAVQRSTNATEPSEMTEESAVHISMSAD
jgi:hypothetical protein